MGEYTGLLGENAGLVGEYSAHTHHLSASNYPCKYHNNLWLTCRHSKGNEGSS